MNSKKIIGVVLASFAMGVGGLAAGAVRNNTQKVNATVVEQNVTAGIRAVYESLGGDAVADSKGQITVNSSSVDIPLTQNSSSYSDYSMAFHKGSHTSYFRNYDKQGAHYYLIFARADANKLDTTATYLSLEQNIGSQFSIKQVTITLRNTNAVPVIQVGNSWTGSGENVIQMTSATTTSYTFEEGHYPTKIFIGNVNTSQAMTIETISIVTSSVTDVYTITYDSCGGTDVPIQYYRTNQNTVAPTDPQKETVGTTKYEFDGWYDAAEGGNKFVFGSPISEDLTLYAHWDESAASKFTISFESNGGTAVDDLEVVEGMKADKPTDPTKSHAKPSKYKYTFDGWYTDEELNDAYDWDSIVTNSFTLYAKYIESFADPDADSIQYDIAAGASNAADSWNANAPYELCSDYTYVVLDSYQTFDKSKSLPQIIVNVEHTQQTGNSGGIFYQSSYRNNPLIRNAKVTVSAVDSSKVITYVRVLMENYGSSATHEISLFANNNQVASDTEPMIPCTEDKSPRLLVASFAASDGVTSFNFSFKNYAFAKIRNMWIKFADNPSHDAAIAYATSFNDAAVCGSTPTDGLNETKWEEQKTAYLALDEAVRTYLTNCEETEGELGEMLERYDRVVKLHGVDYDFMGRVAANKIDMSSYVPNIHVDTQGNIVVLITMLTTLSVIAVGVLLITKKKRS